MNTASNFLKAIFAVTVFTITLQSAAKAQNRDDNHSTFRQSASDRDDVEELSLSLAAYGMVWDAVDEPGWGAGGKIDARVMDLLSVEARGGWVDDLEVDHSNAAVDLVPLDLGLALHVPTTWFTDREILLRPFVMGGASYVLVDASNDFEGDDEPGWYAGGGFELGERKGLGLLVEVMYRGVDIEVDRPNGDEVDADIDGVAANAGIYYRW